MYSVLNSSVGGKSDYITVSTSSAWDSSDAPEAFANAMPSTSHTYTGIINAASGARCVAIGLKGSASSAVVMTFTYSSTVCFWVKWAGTWTKRTFTLT